MASNLNIYAEKRDFRAIVFTSKVISTSAEVASMFGGRNIYAKESSNITKVKFESTSCFLRSSDEARKSALRVSETGLFSYDVYVVSHRRGQDNLFMVAVPFSGMAREVFGQIHDKKKFSSFAYFRPQLDQMVNKLSAKEKGSEQFSVTGVNWAVSGDTGRSDQITLRGRDVIESKLYRTLNETKPGLDLSLRKIQLRFKTSNQRDVKVSFDKFGNYGLWVSAEGASLSSVFRIIDLLQKMKIMKADHEFPVRNREDEPLMP